MKLKEARLIAEELVGALAPACERIEVAGSVRRGKANPKDIEIVFIPKRGERMKDLFSMENYLLTDDVLERLNVEGVLQRDSVTVRWGPKYKRAVHRASGAVVEMFAATEENWGYIYALRTGPGDFNKVLVRSVGDGGALPLGLSLRDGHLWDRRNPFRVHVIRVETEEEFFEAMGMPCWPPEERTPERLREWLRERVR